ncbi:hypothetical protein AMECASPLE_018943 [Ameca splendens]|uniref:Secreted protein n=1 Tax=Ameca splendens TaxID=208324 RepID=A0ABV0ZNC4_9TELE
MHSSVYTLNILLWLVLHESLYQCGAAWKQSALGPSEALRKPRFFDGNGGRGSSCDPWVAGLNPRSVPLLLCPCERHSPYLLMVVRGLGSVSLLQGSCGYNVAYYCQCV